MPSGWPRPINAPPFFQRLHFRLPCKKPRSDVPPGRLSKAAGLKRHEAIWGYALYVFPQEKKKKSTPARREKIVFARLLFPSQICLGPIGKDSGRTPADKIERSKNKIRSWIFFTSVTDNGCKKLFFVPSVIGKIHSFISSDVAAGDRQIFPVRNRECVQKTNFFRP